MIKNPIIRKEVLSALRTKKAVAMQGLMFAVMAGLLWLLWPLDGLQDVGGQQARRILGILAIGELVMIALFAPALTAAALTSEKEHNTLESLFTTTMKPWEIVLGKMVGALAFLVLLVLSGTPALAAVFLLGGVTGSEVLAVICILLLTAVYLGVIGFLVSAIMHRSYRAIIVTYVVQGVVCFLFAVPAWPVSNHLIIKAGGANQAILHILASLSPLEAMASLVWPGGQYTQGAPSMPSFWGMFIPLSIAVIVIVTIVCLIKLRRPAQPPRPREKLKVVERGKVSARTFLFLIDPRKRKRSICWWQNPVLVKEFRTRPMLQTHWLFRAVSISLIVSILLMFLVGAGVTAFSAEEPELPTLMLTAVGAMMVVLVVLVGPAISAGAICSDRETGVWDLLRVTPIPSWRIVSGKFQASILPLLLLTLATLPGMCVLLYFNENLGPRLWRVWQVIAMTILFVSTAGTFFSSLFSRTVVSTAWTYAMVVSMTMLSLLILLGGDMFSSRFVEVVFVMNPVVAAMEAAGHQGMQKLGLLATHFKVMAAATAVMFTLTVIRVFQLRRAE
ncbi:MAG: ABC transporter permease [Phycisphaerae bacterium]|nr:ABC transporter permease [Phycisphaerae bacterium]